MEQENVKELFDKQKNGVARLFMVKWISIIVLVVSLVAMTFIPFIKVDAIGTYAKNNDIKIGSAQIAKIETLFDTQLEDCRKEAEEMKEYLSKEEYNLLYGDIEHDAFDVDLFTDFWKEVDEIIESELDDQAKKEFKGLTGEQKNAMIDAYVLSLSPYSLFDLNFTDKAFKVDTDMDLDEMYMDADEDSIMQSTASMMLGMYGKVFFAIEIVSLAMVALFAVLNIIKFIKKDDKSYVLFFEKEIINESKKTNVNPANFFAVLYVLVAVVYAFLIAYSNGSSFGVAWTVVFVGLFLVLCLASMVVPSVFKKKIEDNLTKEKYRV